MQGVWQMTFQALSASCGPFDKSRKDVNAFCHNLFISYAIDECAQKLIEVEKQYTEAVAQKDEALAEEKRIQLQVYKSSLQLTAHMFEEVDDIVS